MSRIHTISAILALLVCAALAGCRSNSLYGVAPQSNGNSSVVLAMTDAPPSNVSILSAEVTLTGVTLAPGNVSLFSGSTTVELTRLQTDIAYIATAANVNAGTFTSVTLTFANPSLTIENDTASAIGTCAVGAICTIAPTSPSLSVTVPLTAFSIAASSTTGLLIDVSLDNLLTASLGEDFGVGTTVTQFTPAGFGAPAVGAEDVVGLVGNKNVSSNTFTLTNAAGSYSLKVDNTSTFLQFPTTGSCTTPGFACLQNNQILSVDIGIQSDGSIHARNIVFEDADSSDTEIEGMITGTNLGMQQFNIVIQTMSAPVTGLSIGLPITVQYSASPQTPFDIDLVHADSTQMSTSGFLFAVPTDLTVGQQISIRRHSTLSGGQVLADRVRLRSSRITAPQTIGSGIVSLTGLPSIFTGHGISGIQAQTSLPTIFFEIGHVINISDIPPTTPVSVRGPLFNASSTTRPMIATKVVLK